VTVGTVGADEYVLKVDDKVYNVIITSENSNTYAVYLNGKCIQIEKKSAHKLLGGKHSPSRIQDITTSMPGQVVKILLEEGAPVKEGQAVLILEAMKMQNEIKSPQSGRVVKIGPDVGDSVEAGGLLFTVE
jgi:biotin carboxyl carrier protein